MDIKARIICWRKTICVIFSAVVIFSVVGQNGFAQNENNFEYEIKNNSVTITGFNGIEGDIIIPDRINGIPVTVIADSAFLRKRLTSVILPDTVTVIENNAFSNNRLSSIVLPDSVVSVGIRSFANNRLTDITFSNSLTFIGMFAFDSNRLKDISLPVSLTYIGDGSFTKNQLTSVVVPRSVINFNSRAFETYVKIQWE